MKPQSALKQPVLVLNSGWQPINITTVRHAVEIVWKDNGRFICETTYQTYDWEEWSDFLPSEKDIQIYGTSQSYRVPQIIHTTKFDTLPTSLVTFSRNNLFKRDKFRCQYCGVQVSKDKSTVDHVIPRAQGGQTTWDNCVLACDPCNAHKADRTPEQAGMKLLSKPKRPHWQPLYSKHSNRMESWAKFVK